VYIALMNRLIVTSAPPQPPPHQGPMWIAWRHGSLAIRVKSKQEGTDMKQLTYLLWSITTIIVFALFLFGGSQNGEMITADRSSRPYAYAIAEGQVPNHVLWQKSGFVTTTGTAQVTMWNPATAYVFPPSPGIEMEVVSTDATGGDSSAGANIQQMRIGYLDLAGVEKSTYVEMNGNTHVHTSVTDIYRINSFRASRVGALGISKGTITAKNVGSTVTYASMAIGNTRARGGFYTVPIGKRLYITSFTASCSASTAGKSERITLHATYDDISGALLTPTGVFFMPFLEVQLMDNAITRNLEEPLVFPSGVDLKLSVIGESGGTCSCYLRGWIERN
jgi:hypothetical protein